MNDRLACPKCQEEMEPLRVDRAEIDRCTGCGGIWFDAGELDWLAQSEVAEAVDTGDEELAEVLNTVTEIDCPRCGKPMKHLADPHKPDIRYEVCMGCEGAFLDAGEFREVAKLSLADLFRYLFRRGAG